MRSRLPEHSRQRWLWRRLAQKRMLPLRLARLQLQPLEFVNWPRRRHSYKLALRQKPLRMQKHRLKPQRRRWLLLHNLHSQVQKPLPVRRLVRLLRLARLPEIEIVLPRWRLHWQVYSRLRWRLRLRKQPQRRWQMQWH
jgi:hypothetical protein